MNGTRPTPRMRRARIVALVLHLLHAVYFAALYLLFWDLGDMEDA